GGASARQHARRRELADALLALQRELEEAGAASHAAAEALRVIRDAHVASAEARDEALRASRRAREDVETAEAGVARDERASGRLEAELSALTDEGDAPPEPAGAAIDAELGQLHLRASEARAARERASTARDVAREAWNVARQVAEAAETRTVGQRRDRAALEARIAHLESELPAARASLETSAAERDTALSVAEEHRAAAAEASAARAAADQAREARRGELLELERGGGGAAARLAELERAAQASAIEVSRREEALASLAREHELALEGLPEREPSEGAVPVEPVADVSGLDDAALEAELRRVRRTLSQIGSVNPFAVEEHRELAARLEELSTQDADLQTAIGATDELMARLDAEIGERFDAAFRAIGERFDEYCRLLFAGGSASLQMGDEADRDAPGGIEIVVRPPGKRLQRLAMLSGGERALTGVALLFAMLSVNPVPFCILDEVDAALDEANIGRFADALRKLAESIDFVVITHNRATIEVADTIYGVTMTDAAVSRILSLRLADVPAEVSA
ncbi:MAG: hypothetical protein ACRDGV_11880, partial [Candidatus Limnocylindria bacterium]